MDKTETKKLGSPENLKLVVETVLNTSHKKSPMIYEEATYKGPRPLPASRLALQDIPRGMSISHDSLVVYVQDRQALRNHRLLDAIMELEVVIVLLGDRPRLMRVPHCWSQLQWGDRRRLFWYVPPEFRDQTWRKVRKTIRVLPSALD